MQEIDTLVDQLASNTRVITDWVRSTLDEAEARGYLHAGDIWEQSEDLVLDLVDYIQGVQTDYNYRLNYPAGPDDDRTITELLYQQRQLARDLLKKTQDWIRVLQQYRPPGVHYSPFEQETDRYQGTPNNPPVVPYGGRLSSLPNPYNTGPHLPANALGHGAQLGFNLAGMEGGGGSLASGTGSYAGGQAGQSGQAGGSGGYGSGYGGGGGLGHDKADPGAASGSSDKTLAPSPGDKPGSGPADGGGGADNSDVKFSDDVITGSGAQPTSNTGGGGANEDDVGEQHHTSDQQPATPPPPDPTKDTDDSNDDGTPGQNEVNDPPPPGGSSGDPNPDDGTDDSGRMRGLPRYARRRADKFTGEGAVPAQTSLIYRLLAFSSAGLGEDGGGVNPRFFGADPDSGRATGRGNRAADPDGGGGGDGGGGPVGGGGNSGGGSSAGQGGGDDVGGTAQGQGGSDGASDVASLLGGGPDPDNEWGAGGYNPHYQPAGYNWTPFTRGVSGGVTRVSPAVQTARVQHTAAIRFK